MTKMTGEIFFVFVDIIQKQIFLNFTDLSLSFQEAYLFMYIVNLSYYSEHIFVRKPDNGS